MKTNETFATTQKSCVDYINKVIDTFYDWNDPKSIKYFELKEKYGLGYAEIEEDDFDLDILSNFVIELKNAYNI